MSGATERSGPVDRWLDEAFDQMAGSGAAGRRALTEAEDHLWQAVAEGREHGLSQEEAELEAVRRFGSPAVIVSSVQRWPLGELRKVWLSSGRFLAAASLLFFGGYGVIFAVFKTVSEIRHRIIHRAPTPAEMAEWTRDLPPGAVLTYNPPPSFARGVLPWVVIGVVMVAMIAIGIVLLRRFRRAVGQGDPNAIRVPRGGHWLGMAMILAIVGGVQGYYWNDPWYLIPWWISFAPVANVLVTGVLGFATMVAIRRAVIRRPS